MRYLRTWIRKFRQISPCMPMPFLSNLLLFQNIESSHRFFLSFCCLSWASFFSTDSSVKFTMIFLQSWWKLALPLPISSMSFPFEISTRISICWNKFSTQVESNFLYPLYYPILPLPFFSNLVFVFSKFIKFIIIIKISNLLFSIYNDQF